MSPGFDAPLPRAPLLRPGPLAGQLLRSRHVRPDPGVQRSGGRHRGHVDLLGPASVHRERPDPRRGRRARVRHAPAPGALGPRHERLEPRRDPRRGALRQHQGQTRLRQERREALPGQGRAVRLRERDVDDRPALGGHVPSPRLLRSQRRLQPGLEHLEPADGGRRRRRRDRQHRRRADGQGLSGLHRDRHRRARRERRARDPGASA